MINNATIRYYPAAEKAGYIASVVVRLKSDKKIVVSFLMHNLTATENYFIRHNFQDLPKKYYVHKGT